MIESDEIKLDFFSASGFQHIFLISGREYTDILVKHIYFL